MAELLKKHEIQENMNKLSSLQKVKDIYLIAEYQFKSFSDALKFMNIVGEKCDELDHHPKWTNVYNRIEVELFTHDKGGLTIKDFNLSKHMDATFANL